MKRYYHDWAFKHPDPNDFIRVCEKVTGFELDWYLMDWVQTVKTIDYAINSYVSDENSTVITLQRIGQMPMPVEVLVSLNDGSHQTYYIPLTMMRGGKPAGEMISKKSWSWAKPYYSLEIPFKKDDIKFPDCNFMFSDSLIIFDNLKKNAMVVVNVEINKKSDLNKVYSKAIKKIEQIESKLNKKVGICTLNKYNSNHNRIKSNFKSIDFERNVKKIKDYVLKGDVIQTVISQRWKTKYKHNPIDLYFSLRKLNPSPYMFFIKNKDTYIIGASPEVLVRVENNIVETRPIAGTRPRGKTMKEDKKLELELLSDPKEKAEHIMLVDLSRNDISKVCDTGTVKVTDFMTIERYSHVMHIVSNVKGKLNNKYNSIDVFKACFPAGTLSGAPKIRAMQIINELEPNRRGPYGGSVGYIGFSGNMDMSITIRSFYMNKDDLYFQAGAGIVADSKPKMELKETINKSGAMLKAIKDTYGKK